MLREIQKKSCEAAFISILQTDLYWGIITLTCQLMNILHSLTKKNDLLRPRYFMFNPEK